MFPGISHRSLSSNDAATAEKALHDLESLLEKPQPKPETRRSTWPPAIILSEHSVQSGPIQRPKRATHLDGLRGFAALLVYSLHHQVWGHSGTQGEFILENAFGYHDQYYFVCLPGVRLFFSGGHFAVAIFFVISGYVLSASPLRRIHARETTQLAESLGSAFFRRWLRLFIPVLCTTFLWMTSWHLFGIRSSNPIAALPERSYLDEVWKWYCDFKNYSFIFTGEITNAYNDHTWSIPMEFRGSIVVYTALLAFARFKTNKRLLCEAGLIWYFIYVVDGWFCGLFMAGMLICDLELLSETHQLPAALSRWKTPGSWPFYVLFLAAVYLGGVPSITNDLGHLRDSPGWFLLSFFKPQAFYDFRWFYRFWAATFMVVSVPRISWVRSFFEGSFCQYLGRVSFGFYLVHGPVLWTLGDRLYAASGRVRPGHIGVVPGWINKFPFSGWGPFGLEFNYLLPHLILLPLTLCLAEAITTLFDEPSVRFAQWAFSYDISNTAQDITSKRDDTSPKREH
jgi:peptidoglycan/LPS O-acetylase OafA/YrhL